MLLLIGTIFGVPILTGLLVRFASWAFDRGEKHQPELPENTYAKELRCQHHEALEAWDSEFQGATGKRVDWLLDPELEARERRKQEYRWQEIMAPGLQALMNQQQLPRPDYLQQQLQDQQFALSQQQMLAQQGLLGQFGGGQPLDMNPLLAALGITQPKKPS